MSFKDAEEVRHYIGGVFTNALADEEIGPKLRATGIILEFEFSEPDTRLVIDLGTGSVGDGTCQPDSTAKMLMTADLGSAYWQGKVNLPLAMARGKIKVDGGVASLLKLAPLGKKIFPTYIETLRSEGREDLLV